MVTVCVESTLSNLPFLHVSPYPSTPTLSSELQVCKMQNLKELCKLEAVPE